MPRLVVCPWLVGAILLMLTIGLVVVLVVYLD